MAKITKVEARQLLAEFFMDLGKVPTAREYIAAGSKAPIPYKLLGRYFDNQSYTTILRIIAKRHPVEWASIGTTPVEDVVKPAPVVEPVKVETEEPATVQSPLDKLRALRGESDE